MSRKRIENNIAYDEGKRKYYVTFHYGIDGNGKRVKRQRHTIPMWLRQKPCGFSK